MFQLSTTNDVIVEVLANMRKKHPRAGSSLLKNVLEKIKICMDEVVGEFSEEEGSFSGRDEGDYHVHAAAISSRADILLTNNDPHDITKDPDGEPYEIYTADDFFMLVADSNPACVLTVTQKQFDY